LVTGLNESPWSKFHQDLKPQEKIPTNSRQLQTLELPQFLIQILSRILKSSNKESYPLFNSLQINILFEIFQARELYLLIESI
jgi:hypothetical protein